MISMLIKYEAQEFKDEYDKNTTFTKNLIKKSIKNKLKTQKN